MKHLFTFLVLVAMLCVPTIAEAYYTSYPNFPDWEEEQDGLIFGKRTTDWGLPGDVVVKLKDFTRKEVTIPATIKHNGKTYKVETVADCAFTKSGSHFSNYEIETCSGTENITLSYYNNQILESVKFEDPSNITHIGDNAFQGCTALKTITIPNSVETLGRDVFSCCTGLKSVYFQTKDDGKTNITTIPYEAFFFCTALTSLELPEGITTIADKAIMWDVALNSIKLPNTLTTIGSHFLCNAKSLRTLTIPASVTSIDGAFLHGCESLTTVYLLGKASYLQASAGDGSDTFGKNDQLCGNKVTNCTFYVTSDNLSSYEDNSVWKLVDGTYDDNGNSVPSVPDGNDIVAMSNKRDFTGGKWVTAIFPHEVAKSTFGEGTMAAYMESAVIDEADTTLFHVTFRLVDGDNIPANRPLMFYPVNTKSYEMYTGEDISGEDFKMYMTKSFSESVEVDEKSLTKQEYVVKMTGVYAGLPLADLDFYFSNNKFYRVNGKPVTLGMFRCYWHIFTDNTKTDAAKGFSFALDDDETTGISNVETSEPGIKVDVAVYDMNGRRVNVDKANLPKGLFIIGGKKVYVK